MDVEPWEAAMRRRTEYFATFEAREEAFFRRVGRLVPRRHAGPVVFWRDFNRIGTSPGDDGAGDRGTAITANPADGLAFATPRQELSAAALRAQADAEDSGAGSTVAAVAVRYGIDAVLDQPVRTLSGGETALLAMAKADLAGGYAPRLTVASPFGWLSAGNRRHFMNLFRRCRNRRRSVRVLALDGEDDLSAQPPLQGLDRWVGAGPDLNVYLDQLVIRLAAPFSETDDQAVQARFASFGAHLPSPCWLRGENGHGKSLLAKALTGVVGFGGRARVGSRPGAGPARLLFQDVITQALFRPFGELAGAGASGPVREGYRVLRRELAGLEPSAAHGMCRMPEQIRAHESPSLLELKLMLTAARLHTRPAALLLDEPDWGLSRTAAFAFVAAVTGCCHRQGVAVMLISHKPWWQTLAASRLRLRRTREGADGRRLRFDLERER